VAIATTTLDNIRVRIRERAGVQNSQVVTDIELNDIIQDAVQSVYQWVVGKFAPYFKNQANFTVAAGVNSVTLASITSANGDAFYKELGLDWLNGGSVPYTVRRLDSFQDRNIGFNTGGYNPDIRFDIIGGSIVFYPPNANFAGTYTLHYVPDVITLTDLIDLPVELARFLQCILLEGELTVRNKRSQDTTGVERRLALKKAELLAAAGNRAKEPKMVPLRRPARRGF
jgi:hypothetical protein